MSEKKFLIPKAEIINFNNDDVIFTSGPDGQVDEVDIDDIPVF